MCIMTLLQLYWYLAVRPWLLITGLEAEPVEFTWW
jgi:hypothetical protein